MKRLITFSFLLLMASPGFGSTKNEIDHLLVFVETSDCVFIRNGKEYSAEDAVKHIKRKYKHNEEGVDSAETFIELSATKSTVFGQPYYIQCLGAEKIESGTWLLLELTRYRASTNT